jgi:photosystem II stability/assembly factor-like uncharacterized protein
VPAPPIAVSIEGFPVPALSVRFADARDGWIYTDHPGSLWATHDAGGTWRQIAVPALSAGGAIVAMEAGAGGVQVVIIPGDGGTIQVTTSSVATDSWVQTGTGVMIGAGPVPETQLVIQKSQGWLLENDRTVVGGARLNGPGSWAAWTPPCQTANGPATLAASTPFDLVAVCQEGEWGPARNLPPGSATPATWLFRSADGGASFQPVGPLPAGAGAYNVASPAPSTVVVGGSGAGPSALTASFDAGRTWQTVYRNTAVQDWTYLGFTTLTQGVAIGSGGGGSSLLAMTRDGGRSWTVVSFARSG